MKLKGFIKSVVASLDAKGQQRKWTNPMGEKFEFFTAKVEIPYTSNNGQVYNDTLLVDIARKVEEGQTSKPFENYLNTPKPLELTVFFSVREADGKRPWTVSKLANVALLVE